MVVADGVFAKLMGELGIERPEDVPSINGVKMDRVKFLKNMEGKEKKGTSTLKKWCCPECGMKVRMGIAGDPMLRHHSCEPTLGHLSTTALRP